MSTNNAIDNTLPLPFTVGATSITAVPIDKVNIQTFTTSGTYTPTSGMVFCIIEVLGGGGAGGGSPTASGVTGGAAGGGGSGGYSRGVFTGATIGGSQAVTIGAGGTGVAGASGNNGAASSVGALITANGGGGAVAATAASVSTTFAGGLPATVPAGSFNKFPGYNGTNGFVFIGGGFTTGWGADSALGGGATQLISAVAANSAGNAALANTGGGGSGAVTYAITGVIAKGGDGGSGIVIVTEYIAA